MQNGTRNTIDVHDRKHRSKGAVAALVFAALIMLLGIVGYILTAALKFPAAAAVCLLIGQFGNRRILKISDGIARMIVMLVVLFLFFCTPPLSLRSHMLWQYQFQSVYLNLYQNIKEPEWFPDFRNDAQSAYTFDYMPSIMQGTGHFSVCFQVTPERAAEYAAQYAGDAKYIYPLTEFDTPTVSFAINGAPEGENTLSVYLDADFWRGAENARIYVSDAELDWNHPHSSAVIVDTATGRIQLSQYG